MIWVDYGIPIERLREEFTRLLQTTPLWSGVTGSLQVVEAGEKGIQIRGLMSARSSNALWDLRCYIRESMIVYVQQNYPEYLPRLRAELLDNTKIGDQPVELDQR